MTNVKAQSSKKTEKLESRDEKIFEIQPFDIHLIVARLREAASAKAGILTFEFFLR